MSKDINTLLPEYTKEEQRLIIAYRKASRETKDCIKKILDIESSKVIYPVGYFGRNR